MAKFLTEKKTLALTQKITKLLGAAQDSEIMGTVANNSIKNGNEHIYYNIDTGTTVLLE